MYLTVRRVGVPFGPRCSDVPTLFRARSAWICPCWRGCSKEHTALVPKNTLEKVAGVYQFGGFGGIHRKSENHMFLVFTFPEIWRAVVGPRRGCCSAKRRMILCEVNGRIGWSPYSGICHRSLSSIWQKIKIVFHISMNIILSGGSIGDGKS